MGPSLPPRSATLPIPLRDLYVAQEADPARSQSNNPDDLRVVLPVTKSQEVEIDIALSPGETSCTGQEPSHLLVVSTSEVVRFMSIEALAEYNGAGDMYAPVPSGRNT